MEHAKNKFRRKKGSPENVRSHKLTFRVTKAEKERIEAMAAQAVGSTGDYLRRVGLGYPITSRLDLTIIRDLVTQGGNLGRLGGLLKQQLSNPIPTPLQAEQLKRLLSKIDEAQQEMRTLIQNARQKI